MRRVNNKKIKKLRKKRTNRVLFVLLFLAISIYGITICIQISDLKDVVNTAIDNMQDIQDNTVVYKTERSSIYIPKSVAKLLNTKSLKLNIDMKNSVIVNVAENNYGFVRDIKISKGKINIDGTNISCIKASSSSKGSTQMLKTTAIKDTLNFVDALDIYLKQGNTTSLYKTIDVGEYINMYEQKQYLVYIPPQNIIVDEVLNIYNNTPNKLQITVEPSNATYSKITYSDYDKDIIQITEDGLVLPSKTGNATITCMIRDISQKVNLNILATAEKITVNKPSTNIKLGNWSYVIATVYPQDAVNNELEWTSSDESIATVEDGMIKSKAIGTCKVTVKTKNDPKIFANINVEVTEKSAGYYVQGTGGYPETIIEGPYYVEGILIVNKKYSIQSDFADSLDDTALNALYQLQEAANTAGYSLPLISGFRTYNYQKRLYENYIKSEGQAAADTYSARPGHSEHSTGLGFDIGSVTYSYGVTPAGKWLAKNCHKFGFIIRYPEGKSDITGYIYEPWHIRYLGVENATKVYESGLTLEEYLGVN